MQRPGEHYSNGKSNLLRFEFFRNTRESWREKLVINRPLFWYARLGIMGISLLLASISFGQVVGSTAREVDRSVATVVEVIVTGSNIPTAEEVGPNPVDTYRPADIEKLGIRNATDLTTFLPQQAGFSINLNVGNGGDGTVQFNLRGLLSKETLVLVDGKRVAFGSLNAVGFSGGADINLIPFPMIDHIDILKDGASAVYGSDAIAGVVNFFLVHKFRGLEIGAVTGTPTWEPLTRWASGRHGSKPAQEMIRLTLWSLPISGKRTGGLFSADRDLSSNAFQVPWGGFDVRSSEEPHIGTPFFGRKLLPRMFFGPGGTPQPGVNTPLPHSAANAATSPFYKRRYFPFFNYPRPSDSASHRARRASLIPMRIRAPPVSSARMPPFPFHSSAAIIRAEATTGSLTLRLSLQRFLQLIAKPSTGPSLAICVTDT